MAWFWWHHSRLLCDYLLVLTAVAQKRMWRRHFDVQQSFSIDKFFEDPEVSPMLLAEGGCQVWCLNEPFSYHFTGTLKNKEQEMQKGYIIYIWFLKKAKILFFFLDFTILLKFSLNFKFVIIFFQNFKFVIIFFFSH